MIHAIRSDEPDPWIGRNGAILSGSGAELEA